MPTGARLARWADLREWSAVERAAIIYYPSYAPRPERMFSAAPDFSDLDTAIPPREPRRHWAWATSALAHLVLVFALAIQWEGGEAERPNPPPENGLQVTLVSDVAGAMAPQLGHSAISGAGHRPGLAATTGSQTLSGEASQATEIPSQPVVPRTTDAPASNMTLENSQPIAPANSSPAPDDAAPQKLKGQIAARAGSLEEGVWEAAILSRLARKKRFPPSALRAHQEDTVMLRVTIDRKGKLLLAEIVRSRGIAPLDQEALALAKRASPYPSPPVSVLGDAVPIVVPIEFVIGRDGAQL